MSNGEEQVSYPASFATRKSAPKEIPAHHEKHSRQTICQLPMEPLPLGISFEVMSKVSMNPFVPLNS
jgi:hypothetical protein